MVGALSFGRAFIAQDAGMLATVPAQLRGVTGGTRFDRLGGALLHAILRRNIRRDDCVDWKGIGVRAKNMRWLEPFRGPLRP